MSCYMGGSILSKIKRVEIFGPEGKIVTAQPKVVTAKPYSVAEISLKILSVTTVSRRIFSTVVTTRGKPRILGLHLWLPH